MPHLNVISPEPILCCRLKYLSELTYNSSFKGRTLSVLSYWCVNIINF